MLKAQSNTARNYERQVTRLLDQLDDANNKIMFQAGTPWKYPENQAVVQPAENSEPPEWGEY